MHTQVDPGPFATREASGTAWIPEASPMLGFQTKARGWDLMFHGNAFVQFLYESGEVHRTSHQAGSINWLMGMARRPIGTGRVGLRAMISLETWTIPGCGYPDLLATGEACDGDTIHDLQHPHDLFMELAAEYERPLVGSARWQVYGGLAGEPALGPPAFPHRLSAFPNPIAPISHHWLDSTHITYGLLTTGVQDRRWKAEVSAFNGREPNETRTDLDLAAMDSFAGRLSWMPTPRVVFQISAGYLHEAEGGHGSEPATDVNRLTASGIYHRPLGDQGLWATTIAYGTNRETNIIPEGELDQRTHAVMVETSLTNGGPNTWFGRLDVVGKPAHDLHIHEYPLEVFTVGKLQFGYVRHFKPWKQLRPGIGAVVSASLVPAPLAPRYGGQVAPGIGVFFTIQPPRHRM